MFALQRLAVARSDHCRMEAYRFLPLASTMYRPSASRMGFEGSDAHVLPCDVQTGISAITSPISSRTVAKPRSVPLNTGLKASSDMRGRSVSATVMAASPARTAGRRPRRGALAVGVAVPYQFRNCRAPLHRGRFGAPWAALQAVASGHLAAGQLRVMLTQS